MSFRRVLDADSTGLNEIKNLLPFFDIRLIGMAYSLQRIPEWTKTSLNQPNFFKKASEYAARPNITNEYVFFNVSL